MIDVTDLQQTIGDLEMLDDRADAMKCRDDVFLPDVSRIDYHDILRKVLYYLRTLKEGVSDDG